MKLDYEIIKEAKQSGGQSDVDELIKRNRAETDDFIASVTDWINKKYKRSYGRKHNENIFTGELEQLRKDNLEWLQSLSEKKSDAENKYRLLVLPSCSSKLQKYNLYYNDKFVVTGSSDILLPYLE